MSVARLEDVAQFNDDGEIEGLQFDGRDRSIQLWREKKEQQEFEHLVSKLKRGNWFKNKYHSDPEFRSRVLRQSAESRKRHWGRYLEKLRVKNREIYEASPTVNKCQECGHEWAEPFEKQGSRRTKFCGRVCRNKFSGRKRTIEKRRNKGLLNMSLWPDVRRFIVENPWQTSETIAAETGHVLCSVRSVISKWKKRGLITSRGHRPAFFAIEEIS